MGASRLRVKVETAAKYQSCDFADMMDFTANATCTAVKDINVKGKGKVHPRTSHKVPEWMYRHNANVSLTSALDGVGGERHNPAALPPGKDPVPIV